MTGLISLITGHIFSTIAGIIADISPLGKTRSIMNPHVLLMRSVAVPFNNIAMAAPKASVNRFPHTMNSAISGILELSGIPIRNTTPNSAAVIRQLGRSLHAMLTITTPNLLTGDTSSLFAVSEASPQPCHYRDSAAEIEYHAHNNRCVEIPVISVDLCLVYLRLIYSVRNAAAHVTYYPFNQRRIGPSSPLPKGCIRS